MPVQFVIGRAGSGKTKYCLDRIARAIREKPLGPPIYWILPRQATFIAERQLATASGLGGYFRARILSFEDLGTEILSECSGTALPEVTALGRRMILGHLLRQLQSELQFFRSVAAQPGVAAELDSAFSELERAGHDAASVQNQLEQTPTSPALRAKLHDLSLMYSRYTKFLGGDRQDPNHRLASALEAIAQCRPLAGAEIFIDSFYDFTGSERKLIAALAKASKSVTITLTFDPASLVIANPHHNPEEMSVFHRCEAAYRRLWFAMEEEKIPVAKPVLLKEAWRFDASERVASSAPSPTRSTAGGGMKENAPPPLARLERALSTAGKSPEPNTDSANLFSLDNIFLLESTDHGGEVDAVARWIRHLTSKGLRYRDIVVLMRTQEEYHHLIESSFREHNIPFFVDRRRSALHHPLLRLIRSAVAVAMTNFSHAAIMGVIKTKLVGLSDSDADALENYVLLHGIDHNLWTIQTPWTGRRARPNEFDESDALPPEDEAAKMDGLRRPLVDRLRPLINLPPPPVIRGRAGEGIREGHADRSPRRATNTPDATPTVRSLASAIFQILENFQCRQQIVTWMDQASARGDLEERAEHERVWDEVVKLFDEMVSLFGDEPIALADFSAILDSALEGFDLALTPPTVDQVLVGTVDRSRTPAVKAAAVLGLAEGQFPRGSWENSIFTDSDRRTLAAGHVDLDPDTSRRLLDENFLGYIALTRASEHILLTRTVIDDEGKPIEPSPLWNRVLVALPEVKPRLDKPNPSTNPDRALRLISTPRQLVSSLMNWVREGGTGSTWQPVYQWLAGRAAGDDPISLARANGWKALSYRNEAKLDAARAAELFPSPLNTTAYQLESYRMCPFQHFARYGLGLRAREERQVSHGDLSRIFHEVLQRLVAELIHSKKSWQDLSDDDAKSRLSRLTAQLGKQLKGELMLSTARNRYLLAHAEKTLALVASTQKAGEQRGSFRPAFLDVRYGEGEKLPPIDIRTPAGRHVQLSGKIDRIDLLPDGSACAIDYRLRASPLNSAATYHGLSLHLLTYLLLLEKHARELSKEARIFPAAAFCVQLLRYVEKADPRTAPSPDDPQFYLRVKPRGLFDIRVANHLDNNLSQGTSEVVNLFIKKDRSVGRANYTDCVPAEQFTNLLRHVERKIGLLADQIMTGRIEIRPYRIGTEIPCPSCEFRALCRLEPSPGCYDDLEPLGRQELFERIAKENVK